MKTLRDTIRQIESDLAETLLLDRYKIARELKTINKASMKAASKADKVNRLHKRVRASIRSKKRRQAKQPRPQYISNLPITAKKDAIIRAIREHSVVIISGATGSGKTTQIPKFCLAAGCGIAGKIGCTQPRRIAAMTVAQRITEELDETIGKSIGYKIRFNDRTHRDGYIKLMTDGILLAETQNDPLLSEYDTIIVDEAHERSLNIDFVLGILKTLLVKRQDDLKIIITSATIDTAKFSAAFANAPVIEVSGRMFPVKTYYRPLEANGNDESTHVESAAQAVDWIMRKKWPGDILIFMPTEQDIRETCELLAGRPYSGIDIMPLYARLPAAEQSRIFRRSSKRKIIVATNVAETSITIPGIKYVVDSGLARISQYSPRSRTTALPVAPISRSSADQRQGRCGRTEHGICLRLYSEEDYSNRPLYTTPEILRANLADVILRMTALNLGNIAEFPFIDPPTDKRIRDGCNLLQELGAIAKQPALKIQNSESRFRLTPRGRLMAKLPIDPRLSRILIEAHQERCLDEGLVIIAALSIQDPRERPPEKEKDADQAHAAFVDSTSDFLSLLNIWHRYQKTRQKVTSTNQLKKFCRRHFLSFKRMREWHDIHRQLLTIAQESGSFETSFKKKVGKVVSNEFSQKYTAIHKSLVSGFLSNIAQKKSKNLFKGSHGKEVMIFPGSGLFNRGGAWIVAAEMVETSRLFARIAANIDPGWLERLGQEQCKYIYRDPHWERKRKTVVISEQVSLYGLIIVADRKVTYGRINPEDATDIFIRQALVDEDISKPLPFMVHNRALINDIEDMENRLRRRDILISAEDLVMFYKKRLNNISSLAALHQLIKQKGNDQFLRMQSKDLLRYLPDAKELAHFPDNVELGGNRFDCRYQFQPRQEDDGLTVHIPRERALHLPAESLDWMVPGMLAEKITSLIKGLPKEYRKKLVPVNETIALTLKEMPRGDGALITALGKFIFQKFGINIPGSAWPADLLPPHLTTRIAITDHDGNIIQADRDVAILSAKPGQSSYNRQLEAAKSKWEQTGITRWNFKDLPAAVELKAGRTGRWKVYPGLQKDTGATPQVSLRLFEDPQEALKIHKKGVAELLRIHLAKELKYIKKQLILPENLSSYVRYLGGHQKIQAILYDGIVKTLFEKNIRSRSAFETYTQKVQSQIRSKARKILDQTIPVLKTYGECCAALGRLESINQTNTSFLNLVTRLQQELSRLVPSHFMFLYSAERLTHIVRYIQAVAVRAERATIDIEKDRMRADHLAPYQQKLTSLLKDLTPASSEAKRKEVENFFWLIEEFKVSLFAQELKTAGSISAKRLDNKLKSIERMV